MSIEISNLVFAASVFTHLVPETTARYIREAARVLKPGGRAVFSFFILYYYEQGRERPLGFAREFFAFDHPFGTDAAVANPDNPESIFLFPFQCPIRAGSPALLGKGAGKSAPHWSG